MPRPFTCEPDCRARRTGCHAYCRKYKREKKAWLRHTSNTRRDGDLNNYIFKRDLQKHKEIIMNTLIAALLIFAGWCLGSAFAICKSSKEYEAEYKKLHTWYVNKLHAVKNEEKTRYEEKLHDIHRGQRFVSTSIDGVIADYLRKKYAIDEPTPIPVRYMIDIEELLSQENDLWPKRNPYNKEES